MKNFTLKFGKYKGQDFFSTPLWYQEWLIQQKFVARQEEYDILKEGDKIVFNYRWMENYGKKYRFQVCEYTYVKQNDKYIIVSYIDNTEYIDVKTSKIYVTNKVTKLKYLKSTIASIEIIK